MTSGLKELRNRFRRYVPGIFVFGKVMSLGYSRRSFLKQSGYLLSVKEKRPLRADGTPIPWMNYNAVSFLEERLKPDLSLFEYGSGNSTLFFAKLVKEVVSVECDPAWHAEVAKRVPENVRMVLRSRDDPEGYVRTIAEQGRPFDVVIVDAEVRNRCLEVASDHLSERGVILLDDADKAEYEPGIRAVLARGMRRLDFDGLKAGGIRSYRTTVFYRPDNALGI